MPIEEIIRLVVSFVGGGLVSAIVNWVREARVARHERQINILREQLDRLYGPLFFLTSQNERLFELNRSVNVAYGNHFLDKNWSTDERTQSQLRKEAESTIDLGNAYIDRVLSNNVRVMDLLEKNWHLIDPEDAEVLSQFQVDYTRFKVEITERRSRDIPFLIAKDLGEISYMRPEMLSHVRATFEKKRTRLSTLVGLQKRKWFRRKQLIS